MKVQLDLNETEDKIVNIYKALNGIKDKKVAIKLIILEKQYLIDKLKDD